MINGYARTYRLSESKDRYTENKQLYRKYRYMCTEKLFEKKEKSERKYLMITTLKLTLGHKLGRKKKNKEK